MEGLSGECVSGEESDQEWYQFLVQWDEYTWPQPFLVPGYHAVVQWLICVQLFVTSQTAARQATLSFTIS